MNSELRGAIYRKHMFYSQYTKTLEKFGKHRNLAGNEIFSRSQLKLSVSKFL
jgi:hypothetical protein